MAIPEYVSPFEANAEKAKVMLAHQVLEQSTKVLPNLVDNIREKIEELSTSMHSSGGNVTRENLIKKCEEIEDSVNRIKACASSMGSKMNITLNERDCEEIEYGYISY